jgi:hypothetical protein
LTKDFKFTPTQIYTIASHDGGSHTLEAVKNNFDILKGIGFDCDKVTKIASQNGGSLILELFKKYAEQIRTYKIEPTFLLNLKNGKWLFSAKKMEPLLKKEIKKRKNSLKNLDKVLDDKSNKQSRHSTQPVTPSFFGKNAGQSFFQLPKDINNQEMKNKTSSLLRQITPSGSPPPELSRINQPPNFFKQKFKGKELKIKASFYNDSTPSQN